jgi:hypothetical protein
LRRSGAIAKFGTPVSEFAAAGGDAGAGRGCGDAAASKLCAANDQRAGAQGTPRAITLSTNACDGRWRADAGRGVV